MQKYVKLIVRFNQKIHKMKDNYNPEVHIGTQPIRVLTGNIIHAFENLHPEFLSDVNKLIAEKGLQKEIKYLSEEDKIKDIAYVWIDKKITIEESFLSYLWIICYGILVMFDERVQKNQNGIASPNQNEILKKAETLFKYGMSLINRYSKWDLNLPNPERYTKDDEFYIEKNNSVFINALNFILCHELSHVSLGHLENPFKEVGNTKIEILNDEYQADKNAIELIKKGIFHSEDKMDRKVGLVAGLCSLLFFSSTLKGGDHPDQDERLRIGLEGLDLADDDYIWGIAAVGLHLWAHEKNKIINVPPEVETYKEWFLKIDAEIRQIKK